MFKIPCCLNFLTLIKKKKTPIFLFQFCHVTELKGLIKCSVILYLGANTQFKKGNPCLLHGTAIALQV